MTDTSLTRPQLAEQSMRVVVPILNNTTDSELEQTATDCLRTRYGYEPRDLSRLPDVTKLYMSNGETIEIPGLVFCVFQATVTERSDVNSAQLEARRVRTAQDWQTTAPRTPDGEIS